MSKGAVAGELLLVVGLLCLAYLVYVQQEQLTELTLELDRIRGAIGGAVGVTTAPVPPAETEPGGGGVGGGGPAV